MVRKRRRYSDPLPLFPAHAEGRQRGSSSPPRGAGRANPPSVWWPVPRGGEVLAATAEVTTPFSSPHPRSGCGAVCADWAADRFLDR